MINSNCGNCAINNSSNCWHIEMKYFGEIVRYYRQKNKMSMAALAEGICVKDYIYLVEKGKRTPSIEVINKIAAKLHFDWKEYVDYSDNPSPIKAKQFSDKVAKCLKTTNILRLVKLLNSLPDENWTNCYPTCFEKETLKVAYGIYENKHDIIGYAATEKKFISINRQYSQAEDFSPYPFFILDSLDIYARLLLKNQKVKEAGIILDKLVTATEEKIEISKYLSLYININLHILYMMKLEGDYNSIKPLAIKIMKLQETHLMLERLPSTLIFLGSSYYMLSEIKKAKLCFKKAIAVSKLYKNHPLAKIAEKHLMMLK